MVKLDALGNITWQKTLGGSDRDWAYSVQQTSDGGYAVLGVTASNDGDITNNQGDSDLWLVKLNSTGTIVWQKTFGGTNYDYGTSVKQTSDGGLIIAGNSNSNDGDVSNNHGDLDSWIVKLGPAPTLSVNETQYKNIKIYPNPTSDFIHIQNAESAKYTKAEIYSIEGRLVYQTKEINNNEINVSNLVKGNYILRIYIDGIVKDYKFIKN